MTGGVSLEAIILAGGFGTRLRSEVADLPKPLAPIAGRPFLAYLLEALAAYGVTRAVLAVHHRADAVIAAFGREYRGIRLDYSVERQPLGTGGGIRQALEQITSDACLVVNGDTYLDVDYHAVMATLRHTGSDLVLAVRPVADGARYSLVSTDGSGRVTGFLPSGAAGQPGLIGAGVYALRRDLLARFDLPPAFSFETEILARLIVNLRAQAYLAEGFFIDIGVPEDYRRAQTEIPALAAPGIKGGKCC